MKKTVGDAKCPRPPKANEEGNHARDDWTGLENINLAGGQRAYEAKVMARFGLIPCLLRAMRTRGQGRAKQQKRQQSAKDCFPGPAKAGLTISEHGF